MERLYKPDSVWHNFRAEDFDGMAAPGRRDHPSRGYFYRWLAQQARQSAPRLAWCDVGVLSMIDYFAVRREFDLELAGRIVYTGLEMAESIAAPARQQLIAPEDRVVLGDLDDPELGRAITDRFDVVSIRHVLNHCRYYDVPLRNALELLAPGGKVFVNLHLKCSADGDRLRENTMGDTPGVFIGNVYDLGGFLSFFSSLFAVEAVVEIDSRVDGRNKPNQLFIGVKPGLASRLQPEVILIEPAAAPEGPVQRIRRVLSGMRRLPAPAR